MSLKTFFVICTMLAEVTLAWSQASLTWAFDSSNFSAQPTDQILITATITNASDTPSVILPGAAAFGVGTLSDAYDFSWLIRLTLKTVPAHGVLQFDFCTLTPIGGFAQPGVYQPVFAGILLSPSDTDYIYSDNLFSVTVVPEPSAEALLAVGSGLTVLLLRARRLN